MINNDTTMVCGSDLVEILSLFQAINEPNISKITELEKQKIDLVRQSQELKYYNEMEERKCNEDEDEKSATISDLCRKIESYKQ